MLKKSILPALLTIIFIFQGCSNDNNEEANSMISANENVLTSLKNTQYIVTQEADGFKLENAEGKVVIYDIFATWCPPCRKAATHLSSLQKKYKDDLIVIGITIEDNAPNAKLEEFRKSYNANYVLVNSDQNRPLADKIVDSLGLGDRYPIPIMALYKDGKYITHYIGAIEEEFIESDIKRALGK
ncbi:MAG: TlpA family protein disulfide reductase [Sulfurimonas sp.]|nr:TlpA family protein disulfide reductase [Sulfurimonas sp.]